MALPVLVSAGTGGADTGSGGNFSFNVGYPASLAAGNLIFLQIFGRMSAGGILAFPIPSGFSLLYEDAITTGVSRRQLICYKYATGSESGSLALTGTYTGGSSQFAMGRMYRVTNPIASGTISESGGTRNSSGTSLSYEPVTTTGTDELALIFTGLVLNTTIGPVTGESGGDFTEPVAEFRSSGAGASQGTLQVQTAPLTTADTITGGTYTSGFTTNWINRSFALISVAVSTDVCADVWEDSSNDLVQQMYDEQAVEPFWNDMSVDAVPIDAPEDPIADVIVWDSSELIDPSQTDFDDWSWAQAPPLDDLPTDVLLGIYDATEFDDPSQTDLTDYSSYTPPVVPDLPEDGLLASIEDASQYEDPSFTDQSDYSSYTDLTPDDAVEPIAQVWDDTNSFEDPSQTDESDYGTQTDPTPDDTPDDSPLGIWDDGTTLEDPSQTDLEDYSSYTAPLAPDAPDDPIADVIVWDSVEFEDPSQTDQTEYGWINTPLGADAPPDFPISALVESGDKFESPQDDWDYGTEVDPLPLNALPTPPVVPLASPCLRLYVNGPPGVSACNLNTFEQTCDTVEELRGLIGVAGLQVSVRGVQVVGDAGAGVFIWSPTQVGGDDGSNIVFPLAGGTEGAWVRIGYWGRDAQFIPLSQAPDARSDGGIIYVAADGSIRYRGPDSDSLLAGP